MGRLTTPAISLTNCSTMGVPATGTRGLGTVKVWGLSREPRPAMGTIIFIESFYFFPVLPNPPSPRSVVSRLVTFSQFT